MAAVSAAATEHRPISKPVYDLCFGRGARTAGTLPTASRACRTISAAVTPAAGGIVTHDVDDLLEQLTVSGIDYHNAARNTVSKRGLSGVCPPLEGIAIVQNFGQICFFVSSAAHLHLYRQCGHVVPTPVFTDRSAHDAARERLHVSILKIIQQPSQPEILPIRNDAVTCDHGRRSPA